MHAMNRGRSNRSRCSHRPASICLLLLAACSENQNRTSASISGAPSTMRDIMFATGGSGDAPSVMPGSGVSSNAEGVPPVSVVTPVEGAEMPGGVAEPPANPALPPAREPRRPQVVTYDRYSLMLDGERVWLWSGEFHYFRLPSPALWREQLEKFKAIGLNAVSFYFSWAYHSAAPGVYDFSGIRDVDRLLQIADEVGLYVIARPGPYINAELDSGGFPGWLNTQAGQARTRADDYQAAWTEWFARVNAIIARHQITDGGGSVILFQIENEYQGNDAAYMEEMKAAVRADGITVPTFHNDVNRGLRWAVGPGAPDLYGTDNYPVGFDCSRTTLPGLEDYRALRPTVGERPYIYGEFQGGAFDPWGGVGYERCRALTGPAFQRMLHGNHIENQFTVHNGYMVFGGTNWGWLADPNQVYTSYDYGAAFNEQRELTNKVPVLKQQGYLLASLADLAKVDDVGQQAGTNAAIRVWVKENPDTGARFYFVRHANGTATTNDTTALTVNVQDGDYSATVAVNGPDFKILAAGYDMARQRLVYSTSEIMANLDLGDRGDVALLHGRAAESGVTVLRFATEPSVEVVSGAVTSTWDAARGDLRLEYVHDGLARVRIAGADRPALELLLADGDAASTFWRVETRGGPILARGPYLVRTAEQVGPSLRLRGDAAQAGPLEVFARSDVQEILWNGALVLADAVPGPAPVTLPALTDWRFVQDTPEADPAFDDSAWTLADRNTTNNPTVPAQFPVLYNDEYGFHYGDLWYRGHFTGAASGVTLTAGTGRAGIWSAWFNGLPLGSVSTGTGNGNQNSTATFDFPAGSVDANGDNVVSVLVRNMGHNQDFTANDSHKAPRGLLAATLAGSNAPLTWRIQGAQGGENLVDVLRGPQNNGGLHGERVGFALPGFDDAPWTPVTLPRRETGQGVAWYRTTFRLDLPSTQDVPVGLRFTDDTTRRYRVLIFVNGWNVGQYVNDVGPQRVFVLPEGFLEHRGENTLALAVWSADATGGLGEVSLEALANYTTPPR
jgi:beta-galactosidase GanA